MAVSLSAVFISAVLGTILGLISGYYGGWIDRLIMRAVTSCFPFLTSLAIGIVAILGPGLSNVVIAVALGTPSFARIIRSVTLSAKESLYVEAARSMGPSITGLYGSIFFPRRFPASSSTCRCESAAPFWRFFVKLPRTRGQADRTGLGRYAQYGTRLLKYCTAYRTTRTSDIPDCACIQSDR